MNPKYSHIQESGETYDDIGDIMHHRAIQHSLKLFGRKIGINFQKDYTSEDSVGLLRIVLESDDIGKEFLKVVRNYIIRTRDIKSVVWNSKLLTVFLISWKEGEIRIRTSPESLGSIFHTPIHNLIEKYRSEVAYTITIDSKEDIEQNVILGINQLTQKRFIPINSHGEIVYANKDAADFFGAFQVITEGGEVQMIDRNGKVLSESEIHDKNIIGIKSKIWFFDDCKKFFLGLESRNNENTIRAKLLEHNIIQEDDHSDIILRKIEQNINSLKSTLNQLSKPQLKVV